MHIDEYMSHIYAIRRENLQRMCDEVGGQAVLAKRIGFSQSRLSQLMGMPFSEKVARRIESELGMAYGSLDKPVHKASSQKAK